MGDLVTPGDGGKRIFFPGQYPPAHPSEGGGPPVQKTKTNVDYVGYVRYARRRRNFWGVEAQDEDFP